MATEPLSEIGRAILGAAKDLRPWWEQQDGEPDLWYARFIRYRDLGRTRNLNRVYQLDVKASRAVPSSWLDTFVAYAWRERAAAWDEYRRQKSEEKRATRLAQEQDGRLVVLKAARGKLIEAMQRTEATDPSYRQIVADLATITEQLRKEAEVLVMSSPEGDD
jgi:hypothetical protein